MAKKYEVKLKLIDTLVGGDEASVKEALIEAMEGFDDLDIDGEIEITFLEEVEDSDEEEV